MVDGSDYTSNSGCRSTSAKWRSHVDCTDTSRVLSAPSLRWTTWANWCRVRDFHPQPLRSERSVSCRWTNAAKIVNRKSHIVNEIGTPGRTLACNLPVLSGAPLLVGLTRRESEDT